MSKKEAFRLWSKIWRSIDKEYGYPGQFGWDWPTLRVTYPHRAQVLKQCVQVMGE